MPRKRAATPQVDTGAFQPNATFTERHDMVKLLTEKRERMKEALRVYQPLPFQEKFHTCKARRAICKKGNRVGGSLALFVEVARAVLGVDPHGKYPLKGTCVVLGWGERHIGTVIHRYLFRPGAFWMRKTEDKVWVPCSEDAPGAEPSPPLIPDKYYDEPAWEKKNEFIFNRVVVKNPSTGSEWEILACNSKGDPNMLQGINVHLYAIDEDIDQQRWYVEAIMRTSAVGGLLRWAALPQCENDAMVNLLEECEDQLAEENPTAVCFTASMWDNTYTSETSKKEDIKALSVYGEEMVKLRISGEFDMTPRRVYPTFHRDVHNALPDTPLVKVQKKLIELHGDPPLDWCRYATLDPGHNVFAIDFFAVPPPEEYGEFKVLYDELYIRQCDAQKFADQFQMKVSNADWQDWIIDAHGARLTSFDTGQKPRRQYEKALRERGVKCIASGHGFSDGSDDIDGREVAMRQWLRVRETESELTNGTPTLLVVQHKCPNFVREMLRFKKKTVNIGGEVKILDEANRRLDCHAVEAGEYGAAHGLKYVKPPQAVTNRPWLERVLAGRAERRARSRAAAGPHQGIILGARGA